MKYICPQCGRKEIVVGDQRPECLKCCTALAKATESYTGLWMSPAFVIERMNRVAEKHGLQSAESSGRFKQEREAWTSAVWSLGQTESTGKEYRIEIETVDQTPDTKVHYIDQTSGHNKVFTHNIEVVDWVGQVENPMQVIDQKCERMYPGFFTLLVMARSGKIVYPQLIARDLRKISVPFAEIWILGRASEAGAKFHLVRVHPSVSQGYFDLRQALAKAEPTADVIQL
jgi:hypothetical protein